MGFNGILWCLRRDGQNERRGGPEVREFISEGNAEPA